MNSKIKLAELRFRQKGMREKEFSKLV